MDRSNELLETPMAQWCKLVESMSSEDLFETEAELSQLAVLAARASAYVSRRYNGGKHADCVKRQNEVTRKVRVALGYTYAKADDVTF